MSNNDCIRKNTYTITVPNSLNSVDAKGILICETLSFISHCILKNEPTTLRFTDFYFFTEWFITKKIIWKNLMGSPAMGPKLALKQKKPHLRDCIFCFREIFIDILRRMSIKYWNINSFFYWYNTEIDVFVKYPKNWKFLHFPMLLFDVALRKRFWCKTFQIRYFGWRKRGMFYYKIRSLYFTEEFLRDVPLYNSAGVLSSNISGINKLNY